MVYKGGFFTEDPMGDISKMGNARVIPTFERQNGYYVMTEDERFFFVHKMKDVTYVTERATFFTKRGDKRVRLNEAKGRERPFPVNEIKALVFGREEQKPVVTFTFDVETYKRFPEVVKILMFFGCVKQDAEDAAEQTFLELATSDHRPDDFYGIWVWLAKRRALDMFTYHSRHTEWADWYGAAWDKPYEVDFLACLPRRKREVIELLLQGYDGPETAKLLGLSEGTVRSERCRAIQFIKTTINKRN